MSSDQLQRALDFLTHLDERQYTALSNSLSENYTHRFLPASLGGFGMASRNKQEFLEYIKSLESTFKRFNPPKEVIQSKNVVVLHTTSDGKTVSEKSYNNEYIFIVHFEGEKISSVKEYLDSGYVTKVLNSESAAAAQKSG